MIGKWVLELFGAIIFSSLLDLSMDKFETISLGFI